MFANTQMMGLDLGFPDVCLTPPVPVPIPYPDVALGPTAIPSQLRVFILAAPCHNLATVTPLTNGDNPGVAKYASKFARTAGQSSSVIANHAVSRLRPLTIMCWRKRPS